MGTAFSSALSEEDVQAICDETGFSQHQIRRLYSRFVHLDKQNKGYLTRQDLMLIPELAVNPLAPSIIDAFLLTEGSDTPQDMQDAASSVTCNFKQFVRTLARFRTMHTSDNELSTPDKKTEFVFRVYDTDKDGKISREDLAKILSCMVGHHIPRDQLEHIVKRTMKEADQDKDNFLNFEEFKKALEDVDLNERLSVQFLDT